MVCGPLSSISFETDSMIERVYELRMGITRREKAHSMSDWDSGERGEGYVSSRELYL